MDGGRTQPATIWTRLEHFRQKVFADRGGFVGVERGWKTIFDRAAAEFAATIDRDTSCSLSIVALGKCAKRGYADDLKRVAWAVKNVHRDWERVFLRRRRRLARERPVPERGYDPWEGVDVRLDLHESIERLASEDERLARVARWRLEE